MESRQGSQILEFFHRSEYWWQVARAAFPTLESAQHDWVEAQQTLLKQSGSSQVGAALQRLPPGSTQLQAAIDS